MTARAYIITCEHAVNTIPLAYKPLFEGNEAILQTHRAIDLGALKLAQRLSLSLQCPLVSAPVSRLIIDCNRSLSHPHCFSLFTKRLSKVERQAIIEAYYTPYRQRIETLINESIHHKKPVVHVSMHSFTPILNQIERNADMGLLYDSRRPTEKKWAINCRKHILEKNSAYRVRMNYPYRGSSDGLVSTLRKHHSEMDYLGFEIEINQNLVESTQTLDELSAILSAILR